MLHFYLQLLETDEDRQLFTELYESHRKQMHFVANQEIHNSDLAEDAVQTVFSSLIDHMDAIRDRSPQDRKNYLLKAVRNAAINLIKREKTQEKYYVNFDEKPVSDEVLEQLCDKLDLEAIIHAIAGLREPYNTVLYCRFVMELDYPEIAATLRKKPDAVRQHLSRGKKLLKGMLEEVLSAYV